MRSIIVSTSLFGFSVFALAIPAPVNEGALDAEGRILTPTNFYTDRPGSQHPIGPGHKAIVNGLTIGSISNAVVRPEEHSLVRGFKPTHSDLDGQDVVKRAEELLETEGLSTNGDFFDHRPRSKYNVRGGTSNHPAVKRAETSTEGAGPGEDPLDPTRPAIGYSSGHGRKIPPAVKRASAEEVGTNGDFFDHRPRSKYNVRGGTSKPHAELYQD